MEMAFRLGRWSALAEAKRGWGFLRLGRREWAIERINGRWSLSSGRT